MFGVSPSEPCTLVSAKWYDKGFLRIGFRAGSEHLSCFIRQEDDKVGGAYAKVLMQMCSNICWVFGLEYTGERIGKVQFLQWLAKELEGCVGTECRVKVGLTSSGKKIILMPRFTYSPFIEKAGETGKLRYTDYERDSFGPKQGVSNVVEQEHPQEYFDYAADEQEIRYEDFDDIPF